MRWSGDGVDLEAIEVVCAGGDLDEPAITDELASLPYPQKDPHGAKPAAS